MGEENWTAQDQIDYLSGVVDAHRSLIIAYMGFFMTIGEMSEDAVQEILTDLIKAVPRDPQRPKFDVGHREALEAIQGAIARILSHRGL